MAYQDNMVTRVDCILKDGVRICYENSRGVSECGIPEETETIKCYRKGSVNSYLAEKILKGGEENQGILSTEESNAQKGFKKENINHKCIVCPIMSYSDVTENEMFGFPEIPKNILVSQENGLWAFHGLRKLKFHFTNLETESDELEISANLIFDHRDNDEMPAVTSDKNDVIRVQMENSMDNEYELFVFVNTNDLGKKFEGEFSEKQKILFSGYIQVRFHYETNSNPNDIIYIFPVELLVNNTNPEHCRKIEKTTVSIDFGTSSSCVAVRGKENGVELLTLSATEETVKGINIYENPTCVMLYRWEEIYEQWKRENKDFPMILKGNLDEYKLNQKSVQFDFGYSVKQHLKEVNDQQLNSILTEIKMIPKYLDEGEQISVRPLVNQGIKVVELVDSYDKQDKENFDVIAFYGYILGKAINRVEKNKIYTKFQITYPVKFSNAVKERVKASLEYGLQRALPKPLRDARNEKGKPFFSVDMKYPEPVAYIGSMCGNYLTYDADNPEAQLFAVFDFGGGTLDYSFGIFTPDEDDPNSSKIYVLGVDGDSNVGGELLIKRMSYWLYTSKENMSEFTDKHIPFEKPIGEVLPDDCPEEMFDSTATAKSNVRKISERFTREIFQGGTANIELGQEAVEEEQNMGIMIPVGIESSDKENKTVSKTAKMKKQKDLKMDHRDLSGEIILCDMDGKEVAIQVTVDEKLLEEKLSELLEKKVNDFKSAMDRTFENHKEVLKKCGINKYDKTKVHVFEAGNSSRNHILKSLMEESFQGNDIRLVDETDEEFMAGKETKQKKIALTPKTAVAFGQVMLSAIYVDDSFIRQGTGDAPFNWYIVTVNRGNNKTSMLIDKANVETEWKKYGRINSEDMKIYYAETPVNDANDSKLREADVDFLDEDDLHKMLYIRVKGSDSLECCVCENKDLPNGEIMTKIIELK